MSAPGQAYTRYPCWKKDFIKVHHGNSPRGGGTQLDPTNGMAKNVYVEKKARIEYNK